MKEDFTDFIEISGLLKYDPETISKIYRKNPKRLFKRLILLSTLSDVIELNSERIFLQFLCRRISSGSLAK